MRQDIEFVARMLNVTEERVNRELGRAIQRSDPDAREGYRLSADVRTAKRPGGFRWRNGRCLGAGAVHGVEWMTRLAMGKSDQQAIYLLMKWISSRKTRQKVCQ